MANKQSIHNKCLISTFALIIQGPLIVTLIVAVADLRPVSKTIAVGMVFLIALPILFVMSMLARRYEVARRVSENPKSDLSCCPFCGYSIHSSEDSPYICPECGASLQPQELAKYWRESLRLFKRFRSDRTLLRECGIVPPKRR